jgi:hypothetical protein
MPRRNVESMKPGPWGKKWKRSRRQKGERINRHYSQKTGHAERSVANDEHKRSKRRGNY